MQTETILPDDIRYNGAEGQFEARVTLHDANGTRSYACAVAADLSLSLEDAAAALQAQATQRHTATPGLFSAQRQHTLKPTPMRSAQRTTWRSILLRALPGARIQRAA